MAKKTEEHVQYIYVDYDHDDGMWCSGDILETKLDALDDWRRYSLPMTSEGFFLEVVLPDVKENKISALEQIPTYRV